MVFALHRVSSHVKDLVDYLATEAARNWERDGARSRMEAKADIKNMLVNTIGISITRQCARLKFDRIGIVRGLVFTLAFVYSRWDSNPGPSVYLAFI